MNTLRLDSPLSHQTPQVKTLFGTTIITGIAIVVLSSLILGGNFSPILAPLARTFSFMGTVGSSIGIVTGLVITGIPFIVYCCRKEETSINSLPEDVLTSIFSHLPISSTSSLERVCKRFKVANQNDRNWEIRFKSEGVQIPRVKPLGRMKECFLNSGGLLSCSNKITDPSFIRLFSSSIVITASTVAQDMLFGALEDGTINVWCLKTRKLIHFFKEKSGVRCLLVAGDKLYSGFRYGTFNIWDIKEKKCIYSSPNIFHGYGPDTLEIVEERLLLAGMLSVRVWDLRENKEIYSFENFKKAEPMRCFAVWQQTLIFASDRSEITIWDPKNGNIQTLNEQGREISILKIVGDTLFSASYSEDRSSQIINMWDLKTKKSLNTFTFQGEIADFNVIGNRLLLALRNGLFRAFNIETGVNINSFLISRRYEPKVSQFHQYKNTLIFNKLNFIDIYDFSPPSNRGLTH